MSSLALKVEHLSPEEKRALLAQLLREKADKAGDAFPLSYAQERLWFLDQLQPGSPTYNIPLALRYPAPLNVKALRWTFNEIVRRHEILRTTFAIEDGEPVQIVAPQLDLQLPTVELSGRSSTEREAEARLLSLEEARLGFDLGRGPLLRVTLLRLGVQDHVLLITMHHIISDAWSFAILLRELRSLYEAACHGQRSSLPPLTIQYADFAVWQRKWLTRTRLAEEVEHWRKRLAGAPALTLPTDRPRAAGQNHPGMTYPFRCSKEVSDRLAQIGRHEGGTLFMVLLAAFKVLLYRYTGQSDLVLATPIANRNRTEIEGLIGFFVNMLVLRTDLQGSPTFREVLWRVKGVTLDAYNHAEVPFEKLVEEIRPDRSVTGNPIFQVVFSLQNVSMLPDAALPDAQRSAEPNRNDTATLGIGSAKFDLVVALGETPDGLMGAFEYSGDLFDQRTIRSMQEHFNQIMTIVAQDPDVRVLDIPLVAERKIDSHGWHGGGQMDGAERFCF